MNTDVCNTIQNSDLWALPLTFIVLCKKYLWVEFVREILIETKFSGRKKEKLVCSIASWVGCWYTVNVLLNTMTELFALSGTDLSLGMKYIRLQGTGYI
jgi:hypothetical protein